MSPGSFRLFVALSLLFAVALSPWLIPVEEQAEAARRKHAIALANLSQVERNLVVEKNFPTFLELPETTQREFISLHEKLETDRQKQGPVTAALNTYHAWLKTLQPYQRDELQSQTDPQQRLELIRKIMKEQENRKAQSAEEDVQELLDLLASESGGGWRSLPPLDRVTLKRMLDEVEAVLAPSLSAAQTSRLAKHTGLARQVELLRILKEENLSRNDPRIFALPNSQAFERVLNSIEDSEIRERLLRSDGYRASMEWYVLLKKSLIVELERTRRSQPGGGGASTSPEVLRRNLEGLSKEEQDQLLSLSAADFVDELVRRSEDRVAEVTRKDLMELFQIPQEAISRIAGGSGGGLRFQPLRELQRRDRNNDGKLSLEELADIPEPSREIIRRYLEREGLDGIQIERFGDIMRQLFPGRPGEGSRPTRPGDERDRPFGLGFGPPPERPPFGPGVENPNSGGRRNGEFPGLRPVPGENPGRPEPPPPQPGPQPN